MVLPSAKPPPSPSTHDPSCPSPMSRSPDQPRGHRVNVLVRARRALTAVLAGQFRMLAITAALLEQAAELPKHHMDPFDRVLIAHALCDDLGILTRDRAFAAYGVRVAASTATATAPP